MVPVASAAGGSAEVSSHRQSIVVDAVVVLRQLVGRNLVAAHVGIIGVAMPASVGNVDRIDGRPRITGRAHIVNAVAVGAHGDFAVSRCQALPVNAGFVLAQLIGAQSGIESPHEGGIGMTAPAQLRDLGPVNLAFPSGLAAHGLVRIIAGGVAAVATGAGQTFLGVDVLAEFFLAYAQRIWQGRVAIEARVFGLCARQSGTEGKRPAEYARPDDCLNAILQGAHRRSYLPCKQEQTHPIR